MPLTKVEYESTIPQGTNIAVLWPVGTPLPSQSTLDDVAESFGEPFTLAYLSAIYNYNHEGIAIAQDTYARDVYQAFAAAAGGNAPLIVALDPADDTVVDLELKAKYFKEQVKKLSDGTINLITPPLIPASGPLRYILYIAGGVVIIGGGYWLYTKLRGRKGGRRS